MNVFVFDGRLTKDPEQLTTKAGKSFVSIRVAIDRKFKSHDKQDADFFTCFAYDSTATFVLKNFTRGDGIVVHGRIENREPFVTKNGDTIKEDLVIIEQASIGREKKGKRQANQNGEDVLSDTSSHTGALTEDEFNSYMDSLGYNDLIPE